MTKKCAIKGCVKNMIGHEVMHLLNGAVAMIPLCKEHLTDSKGV